MNGVLGHDSAKLYIRLYWVGNKQELMRRKRERERERERDRERASEINEWCFRP